MKTEFVLFFVKSDEMKIEKYDENNPNHKEQFICLAQRIGG